MTGYRIVHVWHLLNDGEFLRWFQARHPDRAGWTYERHQRALFDTGFYWADHFARAMRALGCEAHEIVANDAELQGRWAREHGLDDGGEGWLGRVLLRQLQALRPDVLFLRGHDFLRLTGCSGAELRRQVPGLRVVAAHTGAPAVRDFAAMRGLDLLFAGTPGLCAAHAAGGLDARLLYHAFPADPGARREAVDFTASRRPHGFTFMGASGYGIGGHARRYWWLLGLMARTPLQAWLCEPGAEAGPAAGAWRLRLAARLRPLAGRPDRPPPLPLARVRPDRCRPPVFGRELFQGLGRSRLAFHLHGDAVLQAGEVGALRLFEAAGAGAVVVTDAAPNLADLFEPDREVVGFRSFDEGVEKVRYLLDHDAARASMAAAGHRRVLRDHTLAARCAVIDEAVRQRL